MEKNVLITSIIACIFIFNLVSASETCTLGVTMINQDPYPAVPGDYVKIVFQITGIENPNCGELSFELIEQYPISFDPNETLIKKFLGGTYTKDYNSYLIIPYKVRLDKNALNGENPIDMKYGTGDLNASANLKTFYLEVEDTHADFELHIDDYSYATKELTIEVLNIVDVDVEALTLEIPKQENIQISGTNRVIVGDLDSNEYTTADFKGIIKGKNIEIKLFYTDQTGARRELMKTINFDSSYFINTQEKNGISWTTIFIVIALIGLIVWGFLRKRRKKKERAHRKERH